MVSEKPEIHHGVVVDIEDDFTLVALQNKDGQDYQRYFETPFLTEIGIRHEGDEIEVSFSKEIIANTAVVTVRITKIREARVTSEELEKLRKMIAGLDIDKIRKKFPSII